jgi:ammonia channel protein AmtB
VLLWNGLAIHSVAGFYGFLAVGIFLLAQVTERRVTYFRAFMLRSMFMGPDVDPAAP